MGSAETTTLDSLLGRLEAPQLVKERPPKLPRATKDVSDLMREVHNALSFAVTFLPDGNYISTRTGRICADLSAALQSFEDYMSNVTYPSALNIPLGDPDRDEFREAINERIVLYAQTRIAVSEIGRLVPDILEKNLNVVEQTLDYTARTLKGTLAGVHAYVSGRGFKEKQKLQARIDKKVDTHEKNVQWLMQAAQICDAQHEPESVEKTAQENGMVKMTLAGKDIYVPNTALRDTVEFQRIMDPAIDEATHLYTSGQAYVSVNEPISIKGEEKLSGRGIVAALLRINDAHILFDSYLMAMTEKEEIPDQICETMLTYANLRLLSRIPDSPLKGVAAEEVESAKRMLLVDFARLHASTDARLLRVMIAEEGRNNLFQDLEQEKEYLRHLINETRYHLRIDKDKPNLIMAVAPVPVQEKTEQFSLDDIGLSQEVVKEAAKGLDARNTHPVFIYRPLLKNDS